MTTKPETSDQPYGQISSVSVLGARLTWSFIGPAALLLTAFGIATEGEGWLTTLDAFFAVVVAWMLFGRWYDQHRHVPAGKVDNAPTREPFGRYAALLLAVAAGAWLVANVLGNHVLA